jgi:hypothetical protein
MTIWYTLCSFGTFFRFGYHVPRKIWQPCTSRQARTPISETWSVPATAQRLHWNFKSFAKKLNSDKLTKAGRVKHGVDCRYVQAGRRYAKRSNNCLLFGRQDWKGEFSSVNSWPIKTFLSLFPFSYFICLQRKRGGRGIWFVFLPVLRGQRLRRIHYLSTCGTKR